MNVQFKKNKNKIKFILLLYNKQTNINCYYLIKNFFILKKKIYILYKAFSGLSSGNYYY